MEPVTYLFSNTICKKCGWEEADLPSKGQESQAAKFFAAERAAKMGTLVGIYRGGTRRSVAGKGSGVCRCGAVSSGSTAEKVKCVGVDSESRNKKHDSMP